MKLSIAFALILISVVVFADWCDPEICIAPGHPKHVACDNNNMPKSACPNDAQPIQFGQDLIDATLDEHNKLRNQQANGETPGFEPANRMATMTWDDELAYTALLNTLKCQMQHDQCFGTYQFRYAGQNLGGSYKDTDEEAIRGIVQSWFSEYPNADMNAINKHTSLKGKGGNWTAHFTQVVKDNAFKVGCGMTKYQDGSFTYHLGACNYAVSNIQGQPIYSAGETASDCKSGTNSKYPGLCSENEKYEDSILFG